MTDPTVRAPRRRAVLATLAALAAPFGARAEFRLDGPARPSGGAARSVLLDVVQAGTRLVAVGERGHVMLSDDAGRSWRQARSVPTRSTLTALHATDARTLWAAGHGGVVLQSVDAGDSWTVRAGRIDGPDVLLAIRVEPDGRGLAVGGFGVALHTTDGGASWNARPLLPGEAGERHLNRIAVSAAGSWLIAAEGGHMLRSSDRGGQWSAVKTPYAGSLWSVTALAGGMLLVGGMRGNLVRSIDDGLTWTHHAVAGAGSLTGAAVLGDGRPVLVGVDGTLVLGDITAESFRLQRQEDRATLCAAVALPSEPRTLVAASVAGMRRIEVGP
jgi:photosystem II stability/assembly factor-like uncharacterized protein